MGSPLLTAKLRVPRAHRARTVARPRLLAMLDEGLSRKLTLVSASAGFGKTTLIAEWIARRAINAAWVSLDADDRDPVRLLAYLCAALRTAGAAECPDPESVLGSQQVSVDAVLAELLAGCEEISSPVALVLDDYHAADSPDTDRILAKLIDHLPAATRLLIATREDPDLLLARLRARGELVEIRTADLRFTPEETAEFLTSASGLRLERDQIASVDRRIEGWVAGLQLTAIALRSKEKPALRRERGQRVPASPATVRSQFLVSLTQTNRHVLDYLLEEVFTQQPRPVQEFLVRTSILDLLCGPLCDALDENGGTGPGRMSGQAMLEYLERANLFIVGLDDERSWYRYHHLFAELLRQRLGRDASATVPTLHRRASAWFAAAGRGIEAFRHATAAGDIEGAERILDGPLMPVHSREATNAAIDWLSALPTQELDRRPALWVRRAMTCLAAGRTDGVAEYLLAAESVLAGVERDEAVRAIEGRICTARATLALTRYDAQAMSAHSRAALDALAPDDYGIRASASWILGRAHTALGLREQASRAFNESLAMSRRAGNTFTAALALISLGEILESGNDMYGALGAFAEGLRIAGEHPQPSAAEALLGKARIAYEWNDLDEAEESGRRALRLAQTYGGGIDRFILCELFLARIELARGRVTAAASALDTIERAARRGGFALRLPDIAAVRMRVALAQGDPEAASRYANESGDPLVAARALLIHGGVAAALGGVERSLQAAQQRGWPDQILSATILRSIALRALDQRDQSLESLGEALRLAEPGGFVRSFVDAGAAVEELLAEATEKGIWPEYASRILGAFQTTPDDQPDDQPGGPLTRREREVLVLIAEGLSNQEICQRLFLALDSVKGHNRRIFEKLGVRRRTEAVARARERGLI